jgi:hypothetical protein
MITVTQDEANRYLDGLRESGATNMFGAGPYLQREFGCTAAEAKHLLAEWMRTFDGRQG